MNARLKQSVAVAILTSNRASKLHATLDAVLPQLSPNDAVLICDTGSSDETPTYLQSLAAQNAQVHLVPFEGVFNFARARNALVESAKSDVLVFLDDDCVPATHWLRALRGALQQQEIVGGPVLPANLRDVPATWDENMLWTTGMTGADAIAGRPDSYPACANLAAHMDWFRRIPFRETPQTNANDRLYANGREDAQWCLEARRLGAKILMEPRAVVYHDVPAARFSMAELGSRAKLDAIAAWRRDPTAPRKMSAESTAADTTRFPWDEHLGWRARRHALSRRIWQRHSEVTLSLANGSKANVAPPQQMVYRAKSFVTGALHISRQILKAQRQLPTVPQRIVISAETYFGDTVLLRAPIEWLARSYPLCEISVVATFPWLLTGLSPNIRILNADAASVRPQLYGEADAIIVPYAHRLSNASSLAPHLNKVIAFNWDVGWPNTSFAYRVLRTVPKQADFHEVWNLVRLIAQWPLRGTLPTPEIPVNNAAVGEMRIRLQLPKDQPYFTVHAASALPTKHWPTERWAAVIHAAAAKLDAVPVLLGTNEERPEMQQLHGQLSSLGLESILAAGALEPPHLIECLRGALVALGGCSGPKHLAMALGTPTFTLYGPSAPLRWGSVQRQSLHGGIISPRYGATDLERGDNPTNWEMLGLESEAVIASLDEYTAAHAEQISQRRFPRG